MGQCPANASRIMYARSGTGREHRHPYHRGAARSRTVPMVRSRAEHAGPHSIMSMVVVCWRRRSRRAARAAGRGSGPGYRERNRWSGAVDRGEVWLQRDRCGSDGGVLRCRAGIERCVRHGRPGSQSWKTARLLCRFLNSGFDRAYSHNVLMNIADKARAYREAFRVLKPGARLLLSPVSTPDRTARRNFQFPGRRCRRTVSWRPMRKHAATSLPPGSKSWRSTIPRRPTCLRMRPCAARWRQRASHLRACTC